MIYRSEIYKQWIRLQPCLVCSKTPSEAHHEDCIGVNGTGIKTHDTQCLPLCQECHAMRHHKGKKFFLSAVTHIDFEKEIIRHLTRYMQEKGIK